MPPYWRQTDIDIAAHYIFCKKTNCDDRCSARYEFHSGLTGYGLIWFLSFTYYFVTIYGLVVCNLVYSLMVSSSQDCLTMWQANLTSYLDTYYAVIIAVHHIHYIMLTIYAANLSYKYIILILIMVLILYATKPNTILHSI